MQRRRIPESTWNELRTAFNSGIGLRELARASGIPAGTIFSRAKREQWTQKLRDAKAIVPASNAPPAVSPADAAARTIAERGARHVERMAGVVEQTLPHVEAMQPEAILDRIEDIDRLDKVARRNYGLDWNGGEGQVCMAIQINVG